jgi:hypothetical protein
MDLSVSAVGSSGQLARSFVDVPFEHYRNDRNWVPPLRSEALKTLDRKKNPFFKYADVEHFVLFDQGAPVGRIAATVYPAYNERFATRTGFFGFFECPPDESAARLLLGAAEGWLRDREIETAAGPYNYVGTQEMGLLIDGFDEPPAVFQTYNSADYRALIEASGYTLAFSMSTFKYCAKEIAGALPPVLEAGRQLLADAKLTTRLLNKRRFRQEMRLVRELLNDSFASNSEVTPYEADVFDHMVMPLKPFVDDRLIRFIEKDGKPIAFTVMVPNVNEILAKLGGRANLGDLLKLRQLRRGVNAATLLVVGRIPSARGLGLGVGLVSELVQGWLDGGYEYLHTTWIHDLNDASLGLAQQFGVAPNKQFAVFERKL